MTKKMLHYGLVLAAICALAALGVAGAFYFTSLRGADTVQDSDSVAERIRKLPPIPGKRLARRQQALGLLFEAVNGVYHRTLGGRTQTADGRTEAYEVFEAVRAGSSEPVAYAALGSAQGYSSRIKVLALVDAAVRAKDWESKCKVLAVLITEQNETPGLGTQVADVQSDVTWAAVLSGRKSLVKEIAARYEPPKSLDSLAEFQKQFRNRSVRAIQELGASGPGSKGIQAISGATVSSRAALSAVRQAVQRIRSAVEAETTP